MVRLNYQIIIIVGVKLLECKQYLSSTDWVEPYLIKHYTGIKILDENSNKFVIEAKRAEAIEFIRNHSA